MSEPLDILEEDRLAVINCDRKHINHIWYGLDEQQQQDLFSLSIQEKNMTMIDFFYHKKEGPKWQLGNPALIEAGKNGDIDMVKMFIMNTDDYRNSQTQTKNIEHFIIEWAIQYDCLNIITKLDIKEIHERQKIKLLNWCMVDSYLNDKNEIMNKNTEYQNILDYLDRYNINIITQFLKIFNNKIKTNHIEIIENFYNQYINNDNYLKKLKKFDPNYYKGTIGQIKKKIISIGFGQSAYHGSHKLIDFFMKKNPDLEYDNGETMRMILCGSDVELIKKVVEKSNDIQKYQNYVLTYQEQEEILNYFIHLFDDKEESKRIIRKRNNLENKEELIFTIHKLILEGFLQKDLASKDTIAKIKI